MKNSIITAAIMLFSCIALIAQTGLEKRDLTPFQEINIAGKLDVYISQSNEESISASEEDFKTMQMSNDKNVLLLSGASEGKIYIKVKEINSLLISGASDVYSSDTLKGNNFKLICSGAGDANLLLKYNELDVLISGTADAKLAGKANNLKSVVSGAGDLKAYKLLVQNADLLISGSGDAQVNVADKLKGSIAGAGTLYHAGEPKAMEVNVSGSGEVKKSNTETGGNDTTRIQLGNKQIIILDKDGKNRVEIGDDVIVNGEIKGEKEKKKRKPQSIWSGFELGVNGYLNADNSFNMNSVNKAYSLNYGKSIVVNINFYELKGRLIKDNVTITTGLGSEINNYRFENNTKLIANSNPTTAEIESNLYYDKSKLTTAYLNAPLYLSFATNPLKNGKRLSISPGITAGWRFTTYNKRVVENNGDRTKTRTRDDFNINPFRVNASLRLAYGSFVIFANYSITDFFQKDKGPNLMPFSAGVRLVGLGK
jgi:hypothetical protein